MHCDIGSESGSMICQASLWLLLQAFKCCAMYRNHLGGIYRAWHSAIILYHIMELARTETLHYFFTVSGKDLNGTLALLIHGTVLIKLFAAKAPVKATLWRFSMQICHIIIRGPILLAVVCSEYRCLLSCLMASTAFQLVWQLLRQVMALSAWPRT